MEVPKDGGTKGQKDGGTNGQTDGTTRDRGTGGQKGGRTEGQKDGGGTDRQMEGGTHGAGEGQRAHAALKAAQPDLLQRQQCGRVPDVHHGLQRLGMGGGCKEGV